MTVPVRRLRLMLLAAPIVLAAFLFTLGPVGGRALAAKAVLVGAAGGLAGGLVAGAIGLLTIPLIVLFLGLPIHLAIGTNLFQTAFTAASGATEHRLRGNVDMRLALYVLAGALVAVPLGAWVSLSLPEVALHAIFSVVLAFMAVRMGMRALRGPVGGGTGFHLGERIGQDARTRLMLALGAVLGDRNAARVARLVAHRVEGEHHGRAYSVDRMTPVLLGAGVGFASGLLGIGGGFLVTPLLAGLVNLPTHLAVGTGLAVVAGNSVYGTGVHVLNANVAWTTGTFLAAGGTVGATVGTRLGQRLGERTLAVLFTAVLAAVAWKMAPF